jgi:small-conductance mechanosensitive channel
MSNAAHCTSNPLRMRARLMTLILALLCMFAAVGQAAAAQPATDAQQMQAAHNRAQTAASPAPEQSSAQEPDQTTQDQQAHDQQARDPGQDQAVPAASYAALAALLENEKTRQQLIEQLRTMAPGQQTEHAGTGQPATSAQATAGNSKPSFSQRLALKTEQFTVNLAHDFSQTAGMIRALATGQAVASAPLQRAAPMLRVLAMTVLTVLIAYVLLRRLAAPGVARLNTWIQKEGAKPVFASKQDSQRTPIPAPPPEQAGPGMAPVHRRFHRIRLSRKLLGVLAALLIDAAATLLAALAGYICALWMTDGGPHAVFALDFLGAFVMIEIVKAISRGIFATRYEHLRLLPLSPEAANYWNLWLCRLISVTGYALMIIVPITRAVLLPSVAQVLGLLIMLGIYVYGVRVTWINRKTVRAGLLRHAEQTRTAVFGTLIRILGRIWHVLVILYFTILLIVSQADQQDALEFMASATIQSAVAIVIGMLIGAALTQLLSRHLTLPDRWRAAFPSLETRLNSYFPALLHGSRLLILAATTLVVLDAWQAFDLAGWIESGTGKAVVAHLFRIVIILAFAALSWTILASIIEHRLTGRGTRRATEREKTLLMLFRNAAAIVIVTMTILILLSQIGIDIGPLIAGAGVAGLAIGFGAQKLVQDVITGVFIQLENGMNQNDIVEVAGLFGTVEKITIRSVVIRTLDGGYHLIPFSVIDKVSNHTRDFGYHYGEYNIAHRESVDEAMAQLRLAFEDLKGDESVAPQILEDIDIPGVTALNDRGFTIRVLIKTTPGNQWAIQRAFNRYVKQRFDAAGIELPYPQTVLHFGRDKSGYAAPVDIRALDALKEQSAAVPPPGQTMRPGPQPAT